MRWQARDVQLGRGRRNWLHLPAERQGEVALRAVSGLSAQIQRHRIAESQSDQAVASLYLHATTTQRVRERSQVPGDLLRTALYLRRYLMAGTLLALLALLAMLVACVRVAAARHLGLGRLVGMPL